MADCLNREQSFCTPRLFAWARASIFCLLSSVLCPLAAEELPDPTHPPAGIFAPAATAAAQETTEKAENQTSGLRSIIISKNRRAAIIDGKTVELGGKHGGEELVEVNEGSIVLQGAQGRRVMTLFPDVKITKKEAEASPGLQSPVNEMQSGKHKSKVQSGKHKTKPAVHKEEK